MPPTIPPIRMRSHMVLPPARRSLAAVWSLAGAWDQESSRLLSRKCRQFHALSAFFCRLMAPQADASPVGAGRRIGPRLAAFHQGRDEFVDPVRVRAAVAPALD